MVTADAGTAPVGTPSIGALTLSSWLDEIAAKRKVITAQDGEIAEIKQEDEILCLQSTELKFAVMEAQELSGSEREQAEFELLGTKAALNLDLADALGRSCVADDGVRGELEVRHECYLRSAAIDFCRLIDGYEVEPDTWLLMAQLFLRLKRRDDALAALGEALRSNHTPTVVEARKAVARLGEDREEVARLSLSTSETIASLAERTFLREGGVTVTQVRLVAAKRTFAMRRIGSASCHTQDADAPNLVGPICVIALGLISIPVTYGILLLLGILWLVRYPRPSPTYWLGVRTDLGTRRVMDSADKRVVLRIVDAVDKALANRRLSLDRGPSEGLGRSRHAPGDEMRDEDVPDPHWRPGPSEGLGRSRHAPEDEVRDEDVPDPHWRPHA